MLSGQELDGSSNLKNLKRALYSNISDLVSATKQAADPLAPPDAIRSVSLPICSWFLWCHSSHIFFLFSPRRSTSLLNISAIFPQVMTTIQAVVNAVRQLIIEAKNLVAKREQRENEAIIARL